MAARAARAAAQLLQQQQAAAQPQGADGSEEAGADARPRGRMSGRTGAAPPGLSRNGNAFVWFSLCVYPCACACLCRVGRGRTGAPLGLSRNGMVLVCMHCACVRACVCVCVWRACDRFDISVLDVFFF